MTFERQVGDLALQLHDPLRQRADGRHGLMRGPSAETTTRLFAFRRELPNRPAEAEGDRHDLAVGSPRHVMEVLRVIEPNLSVQRRIASCETAIPRASINSETSRRLRPKR